MSKHHVIPSSRGGKHTCELPDNYHEAWHICFKNLTPEEICIFVRKLQNLMLKRNELTWSDINSLMKEVKEG